MPRNELYRVRHQFIVSLPLGKILVKTETKRLQDEYDALDNELLDSILN